MHFYTFKKDYQTKGVPEKGFMLTRNVRNINKKDFKP